MLRELSTVLLELQEALMPLWDDQMGGMGSAQTPLPGAAIRLKDASLELPLDMRIVFAGGEPLLQADVARSLSSWTTIASTVCIRLEGRSV